MKTRFRILTIFFTLGLLSAFGWLDFILIKISMNKNDFGAGQITGIIVLSLFVVAGLISIQRLAKTVRFENDKMIINWLFRTKRLEYDLKDILGFQWSSLTAQPVDYKQIIIYTSDKKTIGISDFECGNFYKIEEYVKGRLEIFHSYKKKADEEWIKMEYEKSKELDLDQMKMINFVIYTLWALIGFILWLTLKDLNSLIGLSTGRLVISLISLLFLILSVWKYQIERKRKQRITAYNNV
ncbi:hypothetical protein [Saccharicrinis aurantiacus]|uniref:hypothetical protein n=1 Tax=Saccharicrinis aurantiacus TaxID=1849719 RepID=UPI00248F81F2|nr:hypothetical protein [Saccharicrinis aurantiacus]